MEEAPGDGTDVVEELGGLVGFRSLNGAGTHEETKVGVDFAGGTVGDSPVVETVSARPSSTFGEIRGNR